MTTQKGRLTREMVDEMLAALKDISRYKEPALDGCGFTAFAGVPIIENPYMDDLFPVIQLSADVNVSDEFRKKCNQYYIDMFGYSEPMMFRTQFGVVVGSNFKNILLNATA